MQLDLKRMRYIVEAARAEAVTTAAQTLSITQSALSRSIAEVEEELGVKLFHRRPRGIELTESGMRFVAEARRILGDIDDLVGDMRHATEHVTGRLRIGFTPASYLSYARNTIRRLADEHPHISIEVVTGTAQSLCPKLLQGELNLIVGPSSYFRRWREINISEVAKTHFACALRKDHPLSTKNDVNELDVLEYPVILPESVEPIFSDLAQRFSHHGLGPVEPRYTVDDNDLMFQLVATTDAWTPVMHVSPTFDDLPKYFCMLEDVVIIPNHYISIATTNIHSPSPLAERFSELFTSDLKTDHS